MKKLKLEIDALEVESFELARDAAQFGTVKGREYSSGPIGCNDACYTQDAGCGPATRDNCYSEWNCYTREPSCEQTCNATCEYSCMCVSNEIACIDP